MACNPGLNFWLQKEGDDEVGAGVHEFKFAACFLRSIDLSKFGMVNGRNDRLGRFRRDSRAYSLHQRQTGKYAAERMKERLFLNTGAFLFMHSRKLARRQEHGRARRIKLIAFALFGVVSSIRKPRLRTPDPIVPRNVTIESFTDQRCSELFGFNKCELTELKHHLQIPEFISIGQGKHKYSVSGEKGLLIMLHRYHSPSQRVSLDANLFGMDYSSLSKVFSSMVGWMYERWNHKLNNLDSAYTKFQTFNQKILTKIIQAGYPVPADAANCVLFADGMRLPIARPSGEYYAQQAYYTGHKKRHCLGVQGVLAPDGMFYHIFDEPVGRHQDRYYMSHSGVNEQLAALQQHNIRQYWCYTDKGYNASTHIRAAAHGPGEVTDQDLLDNYIMSKERIGVEWGFGKLKARCPYLDHHKKLKLQESDVRMRVRVAVLLCNVHTCLKQSQVGVYFNCAAPTLAAYLG